MPACSLFNYLLHFFYFLLPKYYRESIVLKPNFRNGDLDGFTVLRSPKSENHIFSDPSLCMCGSTSVRAVLCSKLLDEK